MQINDSTKKIIREILNCFEVGTPQTDYCSIYIYHDGPNNMRQITLGTGFVSGNNGTLWSVFREYQSLGGNNASKLISYQSRTNDPSLADDKTFINLIISTAKQDYKFRNAEDTIYDKLYWNRGQTWFDGNGFTMPLSMAVIQDSFLQSGSMPSFIIRKISEKLPIMGGEEKEWIKSYLTIREYWLAHHSRKILNGTVYRPNFFTKQIENDNWNLDKFPIYPNDTKLVA
jgi:chitosanase